MVNSKQEGITMAYYLKSNMSGKTSLVQTIVIALFGVIAVGAVAIFAIFGIGGDTYTGATGALLVWGSAPASVMETTIAEALGQGNRLQVEYIEIPESELDARLTEALAVGSGPDIVIATQDAARRHDGKFSYISYEDFPASSFTQYFPKAAYKLLGANGVYGVPLYIDPVVLMYNRNLLTTGGYAQPAKSWIEMVAQVPVLTKKDSGGNITQSGFALGTANNIHSVKGVYSALAMQAGEQFTQEQSDGRLLSVFGSGSFNSLAPSDSALRFYTQFSNVDSTLYSWNTAFARSDEAFSAGQVVYIVDYFSSLERIKARNPLLDYVVTELPIAGTGVKSTYARVYTGYVTRATQNYPGAVSLLYALVTPNINLSLAARLGLAPARVEALSVVINDPAREIARRSATYADTWLDPAPQSSELIISDMIREVTSGRGNSSDAIGTASSRFSDLVN